MAFHPYLMFTGTCREAMTTYQQVLGGDLDLLTAADVPPSEDMGDIPKDLVMHAALKVRDGLLLASDDPTGTGGPKTGQLVSYDATDVDDARRVFEALSEGGEVQVPMGETFWSPAFGMCTDRFGTPWMVGAPGPEEG